MNSIFGAQLKVQFQEFIITLDSSLRPCPLSHLVRPVLSIKKNGTPLAYSPKKLPVLAQIGEVSKLVGLHNI
jgi:hypothetical protein